MWILLSEGFWVEPVSNGLDAAAALEQELPDVALIDLYLPAFSGRQLIERMRGSDRLRSVPIIALAPEAPWAKLPPGVSFLRKPVEPATLIACIDELVGGDAKRVFSPERPFRGVVRTARDLARSGFPR